MSSKRQREITSRVIRSGQEEPSDELDWLDATPAERMEAVWTLTKVCMGWGSETVGEPRLDRSVTRVLRLGGSVEHDEDEGSLAADSCAE